MKAIVRTFLKNVGLFSFAKEATKKIRTKNRERAFKKYRDVAIWELPIGELNVHYTTQDAYSKKWFFPRYGKGRFHEPIATKIFMKYVQPKSVVLDIGGHLGYFSCIAGRLAHEGSVHVFEVDPQCIKLINKNLKINNLHNVAIHNLAVSGNNETVTIPLFKKPNPGLVINSNTSGSYIKVKSIKMDDFIAKTKIKPDFVKIDVEGAEWNVLKGMEGLLREKELTLLLEIHVKNLKEHFNINYKACIELLLAYGFTIYNIDHRVSGGTFKPVNNKSTLRGNTMLLCKK